MAKLVILIVVILGVLAITQLVRLYEISSKLNGRREEDIPNRDNRLNATLLLAFMMFMFGGFIWLMLKFGWTGRGEAASESGASTSLSRFSFLLTSYCLYLHSNMYVSLE
jgi:cytochrome c oxidase subunit 2